MIPPPPPMPSGQPINNNINTYDPHGMEANISEDAKRTNNFIIVILNAINTITQICIGGVVISAFFVANILREKSSVVRNVAMEQHIYLCVTGYMILMSQAILTMQPDAGWAHTLKYPQKKTIHWVLQVTGSILAIAGSSIKIAESPEPFQTAHGIVGCIALILTLLSLISGIFQLIFCSLSNILLVKICHITIGALAIMMAFITISLAFSSDTYRGLNTGLGDINGNLAVFLSVGALMGIMLSSFTNIYKRLREN